MTAGRSRPHLLLLALVAAATAILFLQEPGFGDDFTYWNFAFRLHELGLKAWLKGSFHDLRWPVWIVCWLVQGVMGPGLLSYYAEPVLYLIAGAMLAFAFGRMITQSVRVAWGCGLAFLFHPLLDTVSYRPMPDLSEGVWGAATVLCWWALMCAPSRALSVTWAALTGACIYIAESNRITGVFIVPVLLLSTWLHARRRFGWLIAAGAFALLFYIGECAFYHWLFKDWLHNLHANLGGKGHKGTEPIATWKLPVRFLSSLWKGALLAPLYCILTLVGLRVAWKWRSSDESAPASVRPESLGPAVLARVMVIWLVTLYLEYSCAPQSVWPWRPLIRDAERFLCGMAVPMSVLLVLGAAWLLQLPAVRSRAAGRWVPQHPLATGAAAFVILALATWHARGIFSLGYAPEMSRYMQSLPAGTKVFTHESMRGVAFLVDASAARRLHWLAEREILQKSPALEAKSAQADEFWYARKLVWLNVRKQLEKKSAEPEPPLASYFDTPEQNWRMVKLLAKSGDTPDLIFYRRRTPADPAPLILGADSAEFAGAFPKLPAEWKGGPKDQFKKGTWNVPGSLQGKFARIEIEAASQTVEPLHIQLHFLHGTREDSAFVLKPYLHTAPAKEFFALQIPTGAERCEVQMRMLRNAKDVKFTGFRAVVE